GGQHLDVDAGALAKFGGELLQALHIARHQHQIVSVGGVPAGETLAEAGRGSGDECDRTWHADRLTCARPAVRTPPPDLRRAAASADSARRDDRYVRAAAAGPGPDAGHRSGPGRAGREGACRPGPAPASPGGWAPAVRPDGRAPGAADGRGPRCAGRAARTDPAVGGAAAPGADR